MEEYELLLLKRDRQTSSDEVSAVDAFINSVEGHIEEESKFLHEYSDAIQKHDSPLIRFVLELIMRDEEKHHQLLEQVIGRLRADLGYRSSNSRADKVEFIGHIDTAQMLRLTDRFLDEEGHGIRKMQGILRQAEPFYDGLLLMILRMLIKDSEKHVLMLQFLRAKLQEQQ